MVDSLAVQAAVGTALGAVQVTGDLDAFTAQDGKYDNLRVTAASGPLIIDNETNTVTVNPSAGLDLSYTGSTDRALSSVSQSLSRCRPA